MTPRSLLFVARAATLALASTASLAQPLTGAPADPQLKFSTPLPPDIAVPATLDTRLGTLRFEGGVPDRAATATLLDNLDFQHAVQAYLLALPPVDRLANRQATLSAMSRLLLIEV